MTSEAKMTARYIQVTTTVGKKEDGEAIARALLNARLAACVQIVGPIESHYWWKGEIEAGSEFQCLIKSRMEFFSEVQKTIMSVHPYEVPEIIAVPLCEVGTSYSEWMDKELS